MVKSLLQLCTAVCIKNIKEITDVGSMPYSVLRPILLKVDNAAQLRQLEVASPHLEGDDAECWVRLITRDFPVLSERHKFEPRNPTLWHRVYAKYQRLEADQKKEAEEKLKNAFAGIKKEKEGNLSQIINFDRRKLPRPPRDDRSPMGFRSGGRRGDTDTSGLRFTGGSRTKTNTAQSILKKAIREAKEISARNRLNTPTGRLTAPMGQIARPPQAMVNEHIHKARPLTGIRPPAPRPKSEVQNRVLEEREARLRKLKNVNTKKTANFISDEELEEEDDLGDDADLANVGGGGLDPDELEDIFDDESSTKSSKPMSGLSQSRSSAPAPRTGGILSRKPPGSLGPTSRLAIHNQPTSQTSSKASSAAMSTSPPLAASSPPKPSGSLGPSSTGAGPGPRKRKAVDIFMKPKPKVSRP